MIIDPKNLPDNHTIKTDVCIVGAGAAGIAFAREFQSQSLSVAILESGGFELTEETQSLAGGSSIGLPYFPLDASRLRLFGGTTAHWAGFCDPMKALDLETRDGVPHTGWPISEHELRSFYPRAAEVCRVDQPNWDPRYWASQGDGPILEFAGGRVESHVMQIVPSANRRFGSLYRDSLVQSRNVSLYLNSNVTEILGNESCTKVERIQVATLSGKRFEVSARQYVLAAGGIENARILLLSNRQQSNGLGNQRDLVGRFFTEHPRLVVARFYPASESVNVGFYRTHKAPGSSNIYVKGHFNLSSDLLRREQMLGVQLKIAPVVDRKHVEALASKGGKSMVYMAKNLSRGEVPDEFARHLSRIVFDIENIPRFIYGKMNSDELPVEFYEVTARMDPVPNPDSRVTLSQSDFGPLGQPRVELDWRLTDRDKYSAIRSAEILGEEVGASGLGRLQITLDEKESGWPEDLAGGFHHMGTTRMNNDPKQGVVDQNCKVHDLANLYVAGSSVFPTGGSGSPTLTLVALALRLADHIKGKVA